MDDRHDDEGPSTGARPSWSANHEDIFVEWADKAICYSWMHARCAANYLGYSRVFTIPVIVMSTLTGTANFAIERVPQEYQAWVQIGIGSVNIFAGIITTIQQFLKINELSEAHKVASLLWNKLHREINIELCKVRSERIDVTFFLKKCKDEYDRLMETSPTPSNKIVQKFIRTFRSNSEEWEQLNKPEVCDRIVSSRKSLAQEDDSEMVERESVIITDLIKQQRLISEKHEEIDAFVAAFKKEYKRSPSTTEIFTNIDLISQEVIASWKKKRARVETEA